VDHGNFSVPASYGETQLSVWVDEQRSNCQLMNEGTPFWVTDNRIRQLEPIGFQWSNDDSSLRMSQGGQSSKAIKWNERFH